MRIDKLEFITVSSIEDYLDDRLRWCYKWVENRVPRGVPSALRVGKVMHKAFENHFKNPDVSVSRALLDLLPAPGTILDEREQKDIDQLRGFVEPLEHWQHRYKIDEVLEVEEPVEFFLTSGAKFRGRPDLVVKAYGKVFHMQTKTIAGSAKPDVYVLLTMEKLHELLYGYGLSRKYGDKTYIDPESGERSVIPGIPYGGTILNGFRKLKYRSAAKGKNFGAILHTPDEMMFQSMIPVRREAMLQAFDEANELSVHMDRTMEMYLEGKHIPRNRRLDGGRYGNSLDPYFAVALGEVSLADDTYFMDREETYEVEEVSNDV